MLVTKLFRFQENDSFGIKGDEPVLSWNKYLFHDQTGSSLLILKESCHRILKVTSATKLFFIIK